MLLVLSQGLSLKSIANHNTELTKSDRDHRGVIRARGNLQHANTTD